MWSSSYSVPGVVHSTTSRKLSWFPYDVAKGLEFPGYYGLQYTSFCLTFPTPVCWFACVSMALSILLISIRPHHMHNVTDDPIAWCVSHTVALCKNGLTDRGAVQSEDSWGPTAHCIRLGPTR